jgi:hypothetical protein
MNPTDMTEDEFLCAHNIIRESDVSSMSAADMGTTILQENGAQSFCHFPVLRVCGNFRIIRLSATDTGLIDDQHNLVGYYIGEGLVIDSGPASGRALSVPLILEALPQRPPPTHRKVSIAGEAALRKAWRVANGKQQCEWWTQSVNSRSNLENLEP